MEKDEMHARLSEMKMSLESWGVGDSWKDAFEGDDFSVTRADDDMDGVSYWDLIAVDSPEDLVWWRNIGELVLEALEQGYRAGYRDSSGANISYKCCPDLPPQFNEVVDHFMRKAGRTGPVENMRKLLLLFTDKFSETLLEKMKISMPGIDELKGTEFAVIKMHRDDGSYIELVVGESRLYYGQVFVRSTGDGDDELALDRSDGVIRAEPVYFEALPKSLIELIESFYEDAIN